MTCSIIDKEVGRKQKMGTYLKKGGFVQNVKGGKMSVAKTRNFQKIPLAV